MNQKTFFHIILALFLFLLGFISVLGIHAWQPQENNSVSVFSNPTPTPILLSPPSQAVVGTLSEITGGIDRIPWDITSTIPASSGAALYQGDEIITQKNSQGVIMVDPFFNCLVKEKTDILFGNLLPTSLTLQQKTGTIQCVNLKPENTLSFRIGPSLIKLTNGGLESTITDQKIHILIASGSATFGFVNNGNKTEVWSLSDKDTLVLDISTNTLMTSGSLLSTD